VKCGLLVAVVLNVSCCLALSQGVDKNKPYARVCFAVMNSATGEEEAFQTVSTPGKGKEIVAHIDANTKCEAVIAAFNRKTGHLPNGWLPQFVELTEWNEVLLPKAPITWDWVKDAGPIELYVLIFVPGSKEIAELKNLVGAMRNAKTEKVANLQANKLRELIGRAKIDKTSLEHAAKEEKVEVGGVFREVSGFEWRDSARSVNFTADKPAALIFPDATPK
jgi:hypothetical protein